MLLLLHMLAVHLHLQNEAKHIIRRLLELQRTEFACCLVCV